MTISPEEGWKVALIGLLTTATSSWARTARLTVLIVVLLGMVSVSTTPVPHVISAILKII